MPEPKLYDDVLMDHIRNARNYAALEDANRTACGANPLCGDDVTVYVKLEDERLERIAFQCTCCGISMASASIMTETLAGRSAADALAEINVRELIMLGGGKGGGGDFDGAESGARRSMATAPKAKAAAGGEDFEDFPNALSDEDDDLPF